jgi:hypothetical protein
LVEQLLDAVQSDQTRYRPTRNGNGNGSRNGRAEQMSRAQARRVATRVGRSMLVAVNHGTAEHSDDVVVISRAICDLLQIRGEQRSDLLAAAHLHDIGKAAIPAEILKKPGPLTAKEWRLMKAHTAVGADILSSVAELKGIARLVRHSHERWDGQGYPDGLAGEEIPLGSRIIFCADAFHAIRSDRPYRAGRPAPDVLVELRANSGTQFDPAVVAALEEVVRDLRIVAGPRRVRRSNRLLALLLVVGVGMTGSAIARSGLLGEPGQSPRTPAVASVSAGAGGLLGFTFADEIRSQRGAQGAGGGEDSAAAGKGSPVAPGAPAAQGGAEAGPTGDAGRNQPAATEPTDSTRGPSSGNGGGGEQSGGGGNGGDKTSIGSGTTPNSAPGNSGNNPHGGPPGLAGGGPPGLSGGGPPGQAKKG